MAIRTISALKAYFYEHAYPTWTQFYDVLDSFRHKSDSISISEVAGLSDQLNNKVPQSVMEQEISDRSEAVTQVSNTLSQQLADEATTRQQADEALQTNIDAKADAATTYSKTEIDNKLNSVYRFKGSVANYAALPTDNLTLGDVYNLVDTGMNYAWTGTGWDALGQIDALATATANGLLSYTDFIKLRDLATTYATKVELSNASTPPSLAINKIGANGVVSLQIFSYSVALKVTAVTIMSNSTNISVQIGSTIYDKDSILNVTLPANTEMSVLDLTIKAGYTSGSAIITFTKA